MTKPNIRTERVANMKRLVAALIEREMSSAECAQLLGLSTSGTRGYTYPLTTHGVAESYTGGATCVGKYFRIYDEERAAAYLRQLDDPKASNNMAGAPSNYQRAIKDPTRHIHVVADDEPTYPRVRNITPAKPDPCALPHDFFKSTGQIYERRQQPRPEPVRVTGFAALDVRFERRVG